MTPDELDAIRRSGNPFALGYVPSGPRPSDFLAVPRNPGAAPASFLHPAYRRIPVRSQQGGTCVSNSLSTCLTMLEYVEKAGEVVNFDAEAWSARAVAKQYGEGAAASPHDLLDDALKSGVPSTVGHIQGVYFPKAYAWLDYTNPAAIMEAISTPGQVVTGALWLQQNFGAGSVDAGGHQSYDGSIFAPYVPGEPWGLHEVTFPGYDANGLVIQNSWGTWWGDDGFCRITWEHMAKRGTEMLTITDAPDAAGGYVKTYDYGTGAETAIMRYDLPNRPRPAVYLVKPNGRIWIKDPTEAKRFGVRLPAQRVRDTDTRWTLPVIGPDAPPNLR